MNDMKRPPSSAPPGKPNLPEPQTEQPKKISHLLLHKLKSILTNEDWNMLGVQEMGDKKAFILRDKKIGEYCDGMIRVEHGPFIARVAPHGTLANIAESRGLAIFYEITENSITVYAGKTMDGQKIMQMRIE